MKILFRIGLVLLAALLVSGIAFLIVEKTDLVSSSAGVPGFEGSAEFSDKGSGHERPEMPSGDESGTSERPEGGGDHHDVSVERGFSSVLSSFLKISGIMLVVAALHFLLKFVTKRLQPAAVAV